MPDPAQAFPFRFARTAPPPASPGPWRPVPALKGHSRAPGAHPEDRTIPETTQFGKFMDFGEPDWSDGPD